MHYKTKALIQNMISRLPSSLGDKLYYILQRNAGKLKTIDATEIIWATHKIKDIAYELGVNINGSKILEIGTGRSPLIPILLISMGAKEVVTIDLNRYLKKQIMLEGLEWIAKSRDKNKGMMSYMNIERIIDLKKEIEKNERSVDKVLENFGVKYIAPFDAQTMNGMGNKFDLVISYNVMEHIPKQVLENIIKASIKTLNENGQFIHKIDYTDHFQHSDKTISIINFLRFSKTEFDVLAGNKYMYMNRMRDDDFERAFLDNGLEISYTEKKKSEEVSKLLKGNDWKLILDQEFREKSINTLEIIEAWYGLKPKCSNKKV